MESAKEIKSSLLLSILHVVSAHFDQSSFRESWKGFFFSFFLVCIAFGRNSWPNIVCMNGKHISICLLSFVALQPIKLVHIY